MFLFALFANYNNELCKNGRSWYPAAKLEKLSGFKGKALVVYITFPLKNAKVKHWTLKHPFLIY